MGDENGRRMSMASSENGIGVRVWREEKRLRVGGELARD